MIRLPADKLLWIDWNEAADGPMQMALDEILLRTIVEPERVPASWRFDDQLPVLLRYFRWSGQWGSFGCFQSFTEARALLPGMSLVRRWTGGGAVDHRADLTFTLIFPERGSTRNLYASIHASLEHALRMCGVGGLSVAGCPSERTRRPGGDCFSTPVADDLLRNKKKIAGGAQRRLRGGVLHQGSVAMTSRRGRIEAAFADVLARRVERVLLPGELLDEARRLADAKYGSAEWLRGK